MIHTDELYRKIYENAEKEYTEYITELKEKDAEYLIDHAYEIAAMYDIFEIFKSECLSLPALTEYAKIEHPLRSAYTYLSLGGVYKNNQNRLPIALEKYLSGHGEPQEIILRLDRDEVGRNATKDILSGLKNANAKAVFCEKGKDYNEFLMMQKGILSSDRSCGKEMNR